MLQHCIKQICSKLPRALKYNSFEYSSKYPTGMATKRPNSDEDNEVATSKKPKSTGHWSLGLQDSMKDPENIVQEDDLVVVIKDKYPKAQFHYLVMPKEEISSLKEVTSKHEELLKHMAKVAEKIVSEEKHKKTKFNIGYHAQASMFRLHLHVISEDMDSDCVKTKKHWNSFTTQFFIDYKDIHKQLESEEEITLPSSKACKKLLNTPLKCHKCEFVPKHMPNLKRHIVSHF